MRFNQDAFTQGMNIVRDSQAKRGELESQEKMLQLKNAEQERMMRLRFQLQDQAMTPELKMHQLFVQDPQNFSEYMKARNPYGMDESMYKQAMLGLANQRFKLDEKIRTDPPPQPVQPSNLQKEIEFLMKQGMTLDQALEQLKGGGKKGRISITPNFQLPPPPK